MIPFNLLTIVTVTLTLLQFLNVLTKLRLIILKCSHQNPCINHGIIRES